MSLWNPFWTFAAVWAAPLAALWLCARAAVSRDPRARRLSSVALAFVPAFLPLLAGAWARSSGAPAGTAGTWFVPAVQLAPAVPALTLLAWSVWTRDPRWMRLVSAVLGLTGLCLPLLSGWAHLMR